jgi:hypothetical protein
VRISTDDSLRCRSLSIGLMAGLGLMACCQSSSANTQDPKLTASIVLNGSIECFANDSAPVGGKPATCELSAVALDGTELLFANDKPTSPSQPSPIFGVQYLDGAPLDNTSARRYLLQPAFTGAVKYEALAVSPDSAWVFATTAFDRFDTDKADFDRYNTVLAWPVGKTDAVSIVAASERQGIASSVGLRERFLKAINAQANGLGYFKVEGLAVLPGNRLLFGLREVGKDYKSFEPTVKFVEAGYAINNGAVTLNDDFAVVYEFTPDRSAFPHALGVSSLEYDRFNDRVYLVTSFEEGETPDKIGAYLWVLSLDEIRDNMAPRIVTGVDGKPLLITHKVEGLAVLDADRIMLIDDDDRIVTTIETGAGGNPRERRLNESAFQILRWN